MVARRGTLGTTLACLGLVGSLMAAGTACSPEPAPEPVDLSGEWILSDSISLFDPLDPRGTGGQPHSLCKRWGRPVHVELLSGDSMYAAPVQFGGSYSCANDGVFEPPRLLQGSGGGGGPYLTVKGDADSVIFNIPGDQFYATAASIWYIGTVVSRDRLAGNFHPDGWARGTWEMTRTR